MRDFVDLQKIRISMERLRDAIFSSSPENKVPFLFPLWVLALYLIGIFLWGKFFSWGNAPLDYHDWARLFIPRLEVIRNALMSRVLPLHLSDTAPLLDITDRFFVIPDVITTPQMALLYFVNLNTFVFLDVIFHYTIGMVGLLWIRSQKKLSLFAFTVLFFLFTFNGHILSHYAVGHLNWDGYFLLPLVFGLLFQFAENKVGWRWVFALSFSLFYMLLAGSEHHFVWLILFMSPMICTSWKRSRWMILAILFAGLLGAVRLLPPALELATFHKNQNFNFVLGYPSLAQVFQVLVSPMTPVESPLTNFTLNSFSENYWEFNYFIGLIGTVFILYFGLWHWIKEHSKQYSIFILPTFLMVFFSLDANFWLMRLIGLPIFGSERVSSRIISVALTLLFILAAEFFQRFLEVNRNHVWVLVLSFFGLILLLSDLYANLKLWRISERAGYFQAAPQNPISISITNHADPLYFTVLGIGLGITVLAAVFLCIMAWREHKSQQRSLEKI